MKRCRLPQRFIWGTVTCAPSVCWKETNEDGWRHLIGDGADELAFRTMLGSAGAWQVWWFRVVDAADWTATPCLPLKLGPLARNGRGQLQGQRSGAVA